MQQFIYRYNGNDKSQEVVEDLSGGMQTPIIGSIVNRHDKEWQVIHIIAPVSSRGTIPIVRVFLSDIVKARKMIVKHLP